MTPKPASKPIIAVDIDEVIYPFVPSIIDYLDTEHKVKISPEDFVKYDFRQVWSGGPIEAEKIFKQYIKYSGIQIAPIKGASDALSQLSQNYKIIVVSARDIRNFPKTKVWIEHHFPEIFNDIHLVGNQHDSEPNKWRTKSEVCLELGVSYLVDDNLTAVTQTGALGIKALLFGDYAWNHVVGLPKSVTRVKNWQEVLEYFDGKAE
jgi:uncharacterized HAD superfamily protein